ncbi:MAG TPA: TylF/MycF/NovP-related O-methyltransferase, partial [Candidatus Omnitrophota bacterium]|nr:TylF/MycF/NovP-related O-methyltransferase [Candidatus Omnitrophota bacterium]
LRVSRKEVEDNFRKYGLLDDRVEFIEGWFKNSLKDERLNKMAVIRLDGDMYGSTIEALRQLYPKLSPGGFCIIDDYGLEPCRLAVEDYRREHRIGEELIRIDWAGAYWRKE